MSRRSRSGTRERSVVGGSMALVTGRYLNAVLSYIGTAVIARTLAPAEWGGFSLIFSVFALLGILSDVQASRLIVEEIVDDPEHAGDIVGSYMVLRLVLGVAAGAMGVGFIALGNYGGSILQAALLGSLVFLLAPTWNALALLFYTKQWLRSMGVTLVAAQLVQLALTLGLAASGHGTVVTFVVPFFVFDAVVLVVMTVICRRHVDLRLHIDTAKWGAWIREAVPIAVGAALGAVYFRIDSVMLSRLDSLDSVGLYGVGYKFSDLIGYVPNAVMAGAFPIMVAAWPSRPDNMRRAFRGSLILLVVAACGAAALFMPFAGDAIELLYGHRFVPATDAARLLVIGQILHFITTLQVSTLIAAGRHRLYPAVTGLGVLVNVALNLALIPAYSYTGSGWATVLTEVLVVIGLGYGVKRVLGAFAMPWRAIGVSVLAGLASFAAGALLALVVPWFVALVAGLVAFVLVLQVLGVDGPGGLRPLTQLLRIEEAAPTMDLPA